MKMRVIAFLLACLMVLSMTACGASSLSNSDQTGPDAEANGTEKPGSSSGDPGTGNGSSNPGADHNDTDSGKGDDGTSTGDDKDTAGDSNQNPGSGTDSGDNSAGTGDSNTGAGDGNTGAGDGNTDHDGNHSNSGSGGSAESTKPSNPNAVLVQFIEIRTAGTVYVGGSVPMSPLIVPSEATNKTLEWSIISGADLATIDPRYGTVTAKKAGSVVICAKATDGSGVSATYTVTIYPAVATFVPVEVVTPYCKGGNLTRPLYVGESVQFDVHIDPQNASNYKVTWSLLKGTEIASIDQSGVLTTYGVGAVIVYATATDGSNVGGSYALSVEEPLPWKGSGTKEDPYQVSNAEELRAIERRLGEHAYYFKQTADIDLASYGVWAPLGMGEEDAAFRHHYDGGNHTIRNVEMPHNWKGGIFGYCIMASFKNLHIENAYTTNQGHRGLMAAFSHFAKYTTFENCSASVNFAQKPGQSNSVVGGLVALLEPGSSGVVMKDCHVSGYIEGNTAGGLFGMVQNFNSYVKDGYRVENCTSSATVVDCGSGNVGGLVGLLTNTQLVNCTATGQVISTGPRSGGLVGKAMEHCKIIGCTVTGTVSGGEDSDPIVGWKDNTVEILDCTVQ